MKKYLSLGCGVDSICLMLWLLDQEEEFESVFVDHGADYPETYIYLDYLIKKGFKITIIKPKEQLIKHCEENKIIPMRGRNWCTDKFKLRPLKEYFQVPCICFVGIGYYESKRSKKHSPVKKGVFNAYPLISLGMNRQKSIDFIKSHGLKEPPPSQCYICFNAKKRELRDLSNNYPKLYRKRIELENNAKIKLNQKNNQKMTQWSFKK